MSDFQEIKHQSTTDLGNYISIRNYKTLSIRTDRSSLSQTHKNVLFAIKN